MYLSVFLIKGYPLSNTVSGNKGMLRTILGKQQQEEQSVFQTVDIGGDRSMTSQITEKLSQLYSAY